MEQVQLRPMQADDRLAVAELIAVSTNAWYRARSAGPIFPQGSESTTVYFDVYEAIDPGCGIVVEEVASGRVIGSCFYHPRATHISLGIMNAHPDWFGRGVAKMLLDHIVNFADEQHKPLRLVSSAMNLDSFSLYNRVGFVPRAVYQDVMFDVPESGFDFDVPGREYLREATFDDGRAMAILEMDLAGIERQADFEHMLENQAGFWHVSIYEKQPGRLDGFMVSSTHPGCNMIGPGIARTPEVAASMVAAELDRHRGLRPVMLVPTECRELIDQLYQWGGRNCELHLAQSRGHWHEPEGIVMPTFLPESA